MNSTPTRRSTLWRIALVAGVAALVLGVCLETVHAHGPGHESADCALCQCGPPAGLAAPLPGAVPTAEPGADVPRPAGAPRSGPRLHESDPRGPPV